ncbi:prolyl oligopeptidase family serine peptidase [Acuticoccus sp. MNP-M23]|uniref:alpha/beta hydrolase family esterase n=1 Tax=Acuticoccus sp. MNP-M23 TaxID=3072793 RepID=UPI0028150A12|nr:prolyl oligopeptidase family serine peptidase [Acuticoccus sp. MNP-M23]WMS44066.1 prolyl oligopeptidase family serine peptidase [Acuticoccus sp. MNP-M23]
MRLMFCAAALALLAPSAMACGPDTDCVIGKRTYRIAVPEGDGPFGAIVYSHGYRGNAAGVMNNGAMRKMAQDLGVALIATKSGGEDWLIRNAPQQGFTDDHRELDYFDAVLADVTARFPIDADRLLATGFSAGGMMTWTLACHRADRFRGFLPVSGTFWAPVPRDCAFGDVNLIHIHGTADPVVPMAGRAIADVRQGDVKTALAALGTAGAYDRELPPLDPPEDLSCEGAAAENGDILALCLHAGGHMVKPSWIGWGYRSLVGR